MRIGVLGTGVVGTTIAAKLRELGHDVRHQRRPGDRDVSPALAASDGLDPEPDAQHPGLALTLIFLS